MLTGRIAFSQQPYAGADVSRLSCLLLKLIQMVPHWCPNHYTSLFDEVQRYFDKELFHFLTSHSIFVSLMPLIVIASLLNSLNSGIECLTAVVAIKGNAADASHSLLVLILSFRFPRPTKKSDVEEKRCATSCSIATPRISTIPVSQSFKSSLFRNSCHSHTQFPAVTLSIGFLLHTHTDVCTE
jgi:hypothetical protein